MNTQDSNYFSFAALEADDIAAVANSIPILLGAGRGGRIIIRKNKNLNIRRFFNPAIGGGANRLFCVWKNQSSPHIVFLTSNDDFLTLCNALSLRLKYNFVKCSLYRQDDIVYPHYSFHYTDCNKGKRDIIVYKDPKWMFYERGTPLPFEELSLYQNRLKKNRLNNDIIITYLSYLGINFYTIDKEITESYTICIDT